jgi:hypothetical protein
MLGASIFYSKLRNICKPSLLDIKYLLCKSDTNDARGATRRRNKKVIRDKILSVGAIYSFDSSLVLIHS